MAWAWNKGGTDYCFLKEWPSASFLILPGLQFLYLRNIYKNAYLTQLL